MNCQIKKGFIISDNGARMIRRARRTTQSSDGHVGYPLLSDVASGASDEDKSGVSRAPLSYIRERSERCTTTKRYQHRCKIHLHLAIFFRKTFIHVTVANNSISISSRRTQAGVYKELFTPLAAWLHLMLQYDTLKKYIQLIHLRPHPFTPLVLV